MLLISHGSRQRLAFSLARTIVARHVVPSPSVYPACCGGFLSPLSSYRRRASPSIYLVHHRPMPRVSVASPLDPFCFDKVPDRLPDWWNDDEDDDEDDDEGDIENCDKDQGHEGKDDCDAVDLAHDDGSISNGSGGARGGGRGGSGHGRGSGHDGKGKGILAAILAMYTRAIQSAPIRTKSISTCLLALLGDMIAQRIAAHQQGFKWDRRRSASVGIWAFCFMGPVLHSWYAILDRLFLGRFSVWQKLFCDQLFFAPFFNAAFIAGIGSMEGMSSHQVVTTLKSKLWPSMKANWMLWPAAQFVNFAFVPKTFQIVYVNCVALLWNAVLTYISHDDDKVDLIPTE